MLRSVPFSLAIGVAALALIATGVTPALAAPPPSPVIVAGVAYDPDGSTADAGQVVTLTAWPAAAALAALGNGAPVPTLVAGRAVTDANGGFELRYSDPAALAAYADVNGIVDFTVDSTAGGSVTSYGLARTISSTAAARSSAIASGAPVDAAGATTVTLRPTVRPASVSVAGVSLARESAAAAGTVCAWVAIETIGNRWVTVGGATTVSGATATFKFTSGASTTIGMGLSSAGPNGGYTASGTSTVSSTSSVTFPALTGAATRNFRTQFLFKKFANRCSNGIGDVAWQVRPVSFAGGTSTPSAIAPTATHCTPYQAGAIFNTSNATAQTSASGASLAADVGINFTSQSGYNSATDLTFAFAQAHSLCGTNANPPLAARLVAK